MLDKNGDGMIDRNEVSSCLASTSLDNLQSYAIDIPEESWSEILDACDSNNDGFI